MIMSEREDWSWFEKSFKRGECSLFLDPSCMDKAYAAMPSPGLFAGYLHCSKERFMSMDSLSWDFRLNTLLDLMEKQFKKEISDLAKEALAKL